MSSSAALTDALFNPAASFNVDEDGNTIGKLGFGAQVVEAVSVEGEDEEEVNNTEQSQSKLRARNAALLAETDAAYRGKPVRRSHLKKGDTKQGGFMSIWKHLLPEGESPQENKIEEAEEDMQSEESNEEDNDSETVEDEGSDVEDMDDEDMESQGEDDEEEEEEVVSKTESSVKKFSGADVGADVAKGNSIKNQLSIFDSLFEMRIGLQKVITQNNQLPQYNTFRDFLQEGGAMYNNNLNAARRTVKKLLESLISLQDQMLRSNPDTKHILTGKKPKDKGTESDEEITSSSEEEEEESETEEGRGTKRKLKTHEYESFLAKRHTAMVPYRDTTIGWWHDKTKLGSQGSSNKFSSLEVSAVQQLHQLLSRRQELVKRTQLSGATRGQTYKVLGKPEVDSEDASTEEYDPEIFDDSDFYTRCLEEVLKAKVNLSDNMADVSRKWVEIQNIRRRSKRKVDTKASKGRKLRYEVMSKLQQYFAPMCPPKMEDSAINMLFSSVFGQAIRSNQTEAGKLEGQLT